LIRFGLVWFVGDNGGRGSPPDHNCYGAH
jgi:hypothetical protein